MRKMSKIISREYPYFPTAPGSDGAVLAVLVQDNMGKFRAYIGIARNPQNLSDVEKGQDARWIASGGRKLSYAKAVPEYFVGFTEAEYAA